MSEKKYLKILGFDYEIRTKDPDGLNSDTHGDCDNDNLIITIKNNKIMISSFVHEIIEAINGNLALELTHDIVEQLESGLRQILLDNKLLDLEVINNLLGKNEN